jgi:hypothetical protein
MAWLAHEPKAMRDRGGRLWENAGVGASEAAAMSLERVRRVNIPATEMPVSDL